MRCFTVREDSVFQYIEASSFSFKSGGQEVAFPAVQFGEEGRGRELAVVPAHGATLVGGVARIGLAGLGQTKSGRPRLLVGEDRDRDSVLVLFRTPIGYRGSNKHSGDVTGWRCECPGCGAYGHDATPEKCPKCGNFSYLKTTRLDFPGRIVASGIIAEGDAGRMGSGEQILAVVPVGSICRVHIGGRRYGKPSVYYYRITDTGIECMTAAQRALVDLW